MSTIKGVKAREILDSRGNPTIEVDLVTDDGLFSSAVPSGASTGSHEALELRDNDESRYSGKGVLKAVANVNRKIAPLVIGMDPVRQADVDARMIEADGTENKSNFGANAILAVSIAVCKAGAEASHIPLYSHIGALAGNSKFVLPVPMVLVLEGGKHADQSSDIQEFMVMPCKAKSFREAIRCGAEIYHAIGRVLKQEGFNINVGFEGAYGPSLGSNERAFQVIVEGIKAAGYEPGEEVMIAVDAAASEFYRDGHYVLAAEKRALSSREMIDFYKRMIGKYPIISIEDGLYEDDWRGWQQLMEAIGSKVQVVGDDLTVTNVRRLQKAIDMKAINSILIKVNQIGTVTETINAVKLARKHGMTAVVSHRSAETWDTFISDLVVGTGAGQSKFGAPARGERVDKYNELMRVEELLGKKAIYAGRPFRKE